MELTETHQQNLQTAKDFMATLAEGNMEKLMDFWAEDGVLEFPFHPPGSSDRVVDKSKITKLVRYAIAQPDEVAVNEIVVRPSNQEF